MPVWPRCGSALAGENGSWSVVKMKRAREPTCTPACKKIALILLVYVTHGQPPTLARYCPRVCPPRKESTFRQSINRFRHLSEKACRTRGSAPTRKGQLDGRLLRQENEEMSIGNAPVNAK